MSGKGGPAQARRRERRAAARQQLSNATAAPAEAPTIDDGEAPVEYDLSAFDALDDDAAAFADDPDGDEKCSDCGHAYDMHSPGSCKTDGCDCEGFATVVASAVEPTPPVASAIVPIVTTGSNNLVPPSATTTWPVTAQVTTAPSGSTSFFFTFDSVGGKPLTAGADVEAAAEEDAESLAAAGGYSMSWTAIFAPEGSPTDDGRIFAPNSISWRELPLSLGAMLDTPHADVVTASPVCGRIDEVWRDGNLIRAKGVFDTGTYGTEIARMVGDGTLRGVSVDIAVAKFEIAWRSEILDENGNWKGGDTPSTEEDGPDLAEILFGDSEDQVMFVVWDGIIGAVTICPFPAFADATISPASSLVASSQNDLVWTVTQQGGWTVVAPKGTVPVTGITAAAVDEAWDDLDSPVAPPSSWFSDPELPELTPLTVTDEGRIYGHAAGWSTCHIGIPNVCTTPPRSETGYAYFHLKEVECEDGDRAPCGTLTMDTGHADRRLSRVAATRHYDDTGTAVADIVCGEDDHGIWFSGAIRPGLDQADIRKLRGAAVSGDWRNVNGNLEFVALLTVNVPGFPVPRPRALVSSADDGFSVLALTAAGIYLGRDETEIRQRLSRDEEAQFEALRELASGEWDNLTA